MVFGGEEQERKTQMVSMSLIRLPQISALLCVPILCIENDPGFSGLRLITSPGRNYKRRIKKSGKHDLVGFGTRLRESRKLGQARYLFTLQYRQVTVETKQESWLYFVTFTLERQMAV
jgi:hypothetical protein